MVEARLVRSRQMVLDARQASGLARRPQTRHPRRRVWLRPTLPTDRLCCLARLKPQPMLTHSAAAPCQLTAFGDQHSEQELLCRKQRSHGGKAYYCAARWINSHINPFTSRTKTLPAPFARLIALPP